MVHSNLSTRVTATKGFQTVATGSAATGSKRTSCQSTWTSVSKGTQDMAVVV